MLRDQWISSQNPVAAEKELTDDGAKHTIANDGDAVVLRAYMEAKPGTERLNAAMLTSASDSGSTIAEREQRKQVLEISKRRIENAILRQSDPTIVTVETTARVSNATAQQHQRY